MVALLAAAAAAAVVVGVWNENVDNVGADVTGICVDVFIYGWDVCDIAGVVLLTVVVDKEDDAPGRPPAWSLVPRSASGFCSMFPIMPYSKPAVSDPKPRSASEMLNS